MSASNLNYDPPFKTQAASAPLPLELIANTPQYWEAAVGGGDVLKRGPGHRGQGCVPACERARGLPLPLGWVRGCVQAGKVSLRPGGDARSGLCPTAPPHFLGPAPMPGGCPGGNCSETSRAWRAEDRADVPDQASSAASSYIRACSGPPLLPWCSRLSPGRPGLQARSLRVLCVSSGRSAADLPEGRGCRAGPCGHQD